MAIGIGILVGIVLVGAALWLAWRATEDVKQLRRELDETQRQLNDLKAAAEVVPTPLPQGKRTGGLQDLREQLRAAHREESSEE